ncbi:MAG TPA: cation:proton antiporter [Thermoplasmata archaeon]|nr:cation:proton antiporter [Thermoplasmata archaeon]
MTFFELSGTNLLLLIIGATLLVGFASDFLAARLRIPDVIWLMMLGILVGPALGLVSSSQFLVFAPILGVAALVLILFDAGLDMRFREIRTIVGPALVFSAASYAVAAVILFVGTALIFPSEGLAGALLFGLSLACTSGAIVIPIARRLQLNEDLGRLAQLDGAFEDTFAIVSVTSLVLLVTAPASGGSSLHLALDLALPIPVGIVIGVIGGVAWTEFLSAWQDEPYAALATLGFVLVVYTVAEVLGGSGIIAALVLGIVLGNSRNFRKLLGRGGTFRLGTSLRKVQGELAFLLRSFFLLLLGILADPRGLSPLLWAALLGATGLLFCVRWGIAARTAGPPRLRPSWAPVLAGLYGRGLTSAVLIVIAFNEIPNASDLVLPAAILVLLTNVLMTAVLLYLDRTERIPRSTSTPTPRAEDEVLVFGPDLDAEPPT